MCHFSICYLMFYLVSLFFFFYHLSCFCPNFHKLVGPRRYPSKISDISCDHQPSCFRYVNYCRHENSVFLPVVCCLPFQFLLVVDILQHLHDRLFFLCCMFFAYIHVSFFSVGEGRNAFHLPCFCKLWQNLTWSYIVGRSVQFCMTLHLPYIQKKKCILWSRKYGK